MPFIQNVFPTLPRMPRKGLVQIVNADGSSAKTLISAGSNGNKVVNIVASSSDSSARDLQVSLIRSATTHVLVTTTVAANAGNAAVTAPVDLLALIPNLPRDQDGQPYFFLEGGDTLAVSALTSVTAAKVISVHSDHAEF